MPVSRLVKRHDTRLAIIVIMLQKYAPHYANRVQEYRCKAMQGACQKAAAASIQHTHTHRAARMHTMSNQRTMYCINSFTYRVLGIVHSLRSYASYQSSARTKLLCCLRSSLPKLAKFCTSRFYLHKVL
jgi:hypothetical protein